MALRGRPCRYGVRYTLARFGGAHSCIISSQVSTQNQPRNMTKQRAFFLLLKGVLALTP